MVAVESGKILVTGGSGYIGAWVIKDLVSQGYEVVAAARSQSQIDFIVNRFPEYKGKVKGIIVPDIEAEDAYDEAVKDIAGIIHMASPVVWSWEDPSEIISPAIRGAINILKSAKKYGAGVKRVVLTSSVSSISDSWKGPEGTYWDETTWNERSTKTLEEQGKKTSPWIVYCASKTLAEKAAWDFIATEKPLFDLTTILPVWCWGPFIHDVSGSKGVGSTPAIFLSTLPTGDLTGKVEGDWVDVRDTAHLHVLSLKTPGAGGERITTTVSTFTYQDLYDVLLDHNIAPGKVPGKETYGLGKKAAKSPSHSGAKSLRIFAGLKYRSLDESIKEMGKDFVKYSFL